MKLLNVPLLNESFFTYFKLSMDFLYSINSLESSYSLYSYYWVTILVKSISSYPFKNEYTISNSAFSSFWSSTMPKSSFSSSSSSNRSILTSGKPLPGENFVFFTVDALTIEFGFLYSSFYYYLLFGFDWWKVYLFEFELIFSRCIFISSIVPLCLIVLYLLRAFLFNEDIDGISSVCWLSTSEDFLCSSCTLIDTYGSISFSFSSVSFTILNISRHAWMLFS